MSRIVTLMLVAGLFAVTGGCKKEAESEADRAPGRGETAARQADEPAATQPSGGQKMMTVEAGCGGCIYKMKGVEECKLAVKVDGKPYLVTGVDADAHKMGLCDKAKMAEISGKIEGEKFVATKFNLKAE